jgi:hypothetical protein
MEFWRTSREDKWEKQLFELKNVLGIDKAEKGFGKGIFKISNWFWGGLFQKVWIKRLA